MPGPSRRIRDSRGKLNQHSARQDPEKVRFVAYLLWLTRRDRNVPGDANRDYYLAERILKSYKDQKLLLLGSFGFSAVAFVLGLSPEACCPNAMNAVIDLCELPDEYNFSLEFCERLLQPDTLKRMSDGCSGIPRDCADQGQAPVIPDRAC